jgi:hypothetical protein
MYSFSSCCCSAVRSGQRSLLSPPLYAGDPPPPSGKWGETSPRFFSGVRLIFTAVLLPYGTDVLSSGREPCLLRSHRRSLLRGHLSAAACVPYSADGMDLGCGGDVVHERLRPRYIVAQRETSASPWRSGYGDTSSPRSFRARAGFYGQLAWSWLSDVPFFSFLYVNVDVFKSLVCLKPPPCRFHRPS